jgi:hypothetical protein
MRAHRAGLSRKNDLAKAIGYMLKRWAAFARFLEDGRICLMKMQQNEPCAASQSPVHSARVGREVEVCYRWHAHFGRRLRLIRIEPRANGQIAYVEVSPDEILTVAAWMLDPALCSGMEMAEPRASLAALADLHRLLVARGLRPSSGHERIIDQEDPDARLVTAPDNNQAEPPVEPNVRVAAAVGPVPDRPSADSRPAGVSSRSGRRRRDGGA